MFNVQSSAFKPPSADASFDVRSWTFDVRSSSFYVRRSKLDVRRSTFSFYPEANVQRSKFSF